MNDALAQERLQPSLFDRLIDEEPDHSIESDDKRTLTRAALRQAVLRDLGWLLNATGHGLAFDDPRHPHAARSVLNYGLPMLSGQFTSSIQRVSMEQALKQAIVQFEPRILSQTLEVELVMEGPALESHNCVGLQIRGTLWAQPVPLEFLMRSRIDLGEGRIELESGSGGRG
ncbi:MAG: type VI secretion system baseplate subunit TssE [Burkholderiaceae bacterium]|jgi:type VI secretion system protein ImpF|nr:type VI secretion system baseplate subunit TssE [Pseudomonadota bacterium]MBS0597175.1 type VI secretion system baseplate subunit TssE [Pseudomonadota bacterium]MCO5115792.1 type VI secretion system baseplate subunit TssE [Burkholderiaceae bacterium]MCP5219596.1 type VI secretion system baseplate subunit TssE [Burkholderiaceae bacterium]